MTKRAVAYLKANGPEKASQEFTHGSAFKDRDLYVSYYDLTGKVLGHGANPKLVGKNLTGMKDSEGNPFFQMLLDLAKSKGKGWSGSYRFMNPATQKIEAKVSRVGTPRCCTRQKKCAQAAGSGAQTAGSCGGETNGRRRRQLGVFLRQ